MKRGGYGKPWRPPADGWSVPRKIFLGGLYQHRHPATLNRFINNTQVELQLNQVGRPMTRYTPPTGGDCEDHPDNGLPKEPWIGLGESQGLPPALGGTLANTYQSQGTNMVGLNARSRGFKNVQSYREWQGIFGWLSEALGCNKTTCITEVNDALGNAPGSLAGDPGQHADGSGTLRDYIPTYTYSSFEPYRPTPDQVKYLTLTTDISTSFIGRNFERGEVDEFYSTATGAVTVDPLSGKRTSTLKTTQDAYLTNLVANPTPPPDQITGPRLHTEHVDGGAGFIVTGYEIPVTHNYASGMSTILDGIAGMDVHCGHVPVTGDGAGGSSTTGYTLDTYVKQWNQSWAEWIADFGLDGGSVTFFPAISDQNNFSGSVQSEDAAGKFISRLAVSWTRTNTSYTWELTQSLETGPGYDPAVDGTEPFTYEWHYAGSLTLSVENPATNVLADADALLGVWPLNDDVLYPWRTDGIWQVAPLVTRDESSETTPTGFNRYTVDDLRSPLTDVNGNAPFTTVSNPPPPFWTYSPGNNDSNGRPTSDPAYTSPADWIATYTQMPWFDPNAYGFTFPPGRNQGNSAASDWRQYGLTGKILGMPLPAALTDSRSYWYQAGLSAAAADDFQNFFDFRAEIWKACTFSVAGSGSYVDFYVWGHGEWLYDAITRTGAQLPHRATQWTNNIRAMMLPAYAYRIQADHQPYDKNGQPSPDNDFITGPGGILSQKCCEIAELWPSYNFSRPAGADRFSFEQALVFCVTGLSGSGTGATFTLTNSYGDVQTLVDTSGVWGGTDVGGFYNISASGTTVTLGTKVLDLPSGSIQPGFGKLRFPTAPTILGRSLIDTITDNGDGTCTIQLFNDESYLLTGDAIDTFSTAITYDGHGNRVSEAMTTVAANKTVTRLDDKHFKITASFASLAGSVYIMSHGAPAWYWDDNGRKGDFVVLSWLYDYRTNQEAARLAGATDCSGSTPPSGSPTANHGFNTFSQLDRTIPFRPCCPMVLAVTPNGETWPNASVEAFPATFNFDSRYGARWQLEIEQAMTDLLWQNPARPCGLDPTIHWTMDDGTCHENDDTNNYWSHPPMVEARVTVPVNGGNGQNETAPTPPTGIGYRSPVTYSDGLGPPDMIGYDPGTGDPSTAWSIWGYRLAIEGTCTLGCRFDYTGIENLPCVTSYTSTPALETYNETALGNTGEGMT